MHDYIKPGAFVRLRNGSKAKIYDVLPQTDCPAIHGAWLDNHQWLVIAWFDGGSACISKIPTDQDIIGPWFDKPEVYWDTLPAWSHYVGLSKKGFWFWCTLPPYFRDEDWYHSPVDLRGLIPYGYEPEWIGEPRDSLVERPKKIVESPGEDETDA